MNQIGSAIDQVEKAPLGAMEVSSSSVLLVPGILIYRQQGHRKRALGSIDGPTRKRIHHSSRPMPSNGSTTAGNPDIDSNEPTYCYCKQVSFGDMIACDGNNVRCTGSIYRADTALTCILVRKRVVPLQLRWAGGASSRQMVL